MSKLPERTLTRAHLPYQPRTERSVKSAESEFPFLEKIIHRVIRLQLSALSLLHRSQCLCIGNFVVKGNFFSSAKPSKKILTASAVVISIICATSSASFLMLGSIRSLRTSLSTETSLSQLPRPEGRGLKKPLVD